MTILIALGQHFDIALFGRFWLGWQECLVFQYHSALMYPTLQTEFVST